jgi:hypothetical protein
MLYLSPKNTLDEESQPALPHTKRVRATARTGRQDGEEVIEVQIV